MRKKELEEKIKQLEKKVDFLCRYDKDEVAIIFKRYAPFRCGECCLRYIYDGELKEVELPDYRFPYADILENCENMIIVKIYNKYWKVDKSTGELHNITGFYKEKTDKEEKEIKGKKENSK